MQSQVICAGCRTLLVYPSGAANVRCAICNTISSVPIPGTEMAQLLCMGCNTLLMYSRGASSVRCSCCNTINFAREANQLASLNCGRCHTNLMYPYGASSVKCSICQFITVIRMTNIIVPTSMPTTYAPNGSMDPPSSNVVAPPQQVNQTVVVENPMSVDEHGKLVSNVVVGVTTGRR